MATTQPSWTVISQQPTQGKTSTGGYTTGHLITAKLAQSGSTFQVFVPDDQYTVDNVKAALLAKAEAVAAVDALSA